ncbi:MAG: RNA-binding transcriptional accessory protein [Gammaproteobacteria bacterium]|nr:RNA-binding transcriptional accessory protein [Gammaproteobacteria bacterium]
MDIITQIAKELSINTQQVNNTVILLDDGATVPFIARYRKERTGGLDDNQLRALESRLIYLRELEQRRDVILDSIRQQGKLTDELQHSIATTLSKTKLEDLYLPFKPKRRTKAQIAREAGLEPLATALLDSRLDVNPLQLAETYINPDHNIQTGEDALQGARQIIMEQLSENAELLETLRDKVWKNGILKTTGSDNEQQESLKFKDYFDYSERLTTIPSHRALAILRGQRLQCIQVDLLPAEGESADSAYLQLIESELNLTQFQSTQQNWLQETARLAWRIKLFTRIKLDLIRRLRENAEHEAMQVFSKNLRACLLSAPAGTRCTLGLDPGLRTGVKVAVVDNTGKPVATETIYPHPPRKQWDQSLATLTRLCQHYSVELIAIGNGTASRETDQLASELIQRNPDLKLTKLMVSEAGASVYSASQLASNELPDMDVSLRGAVSIARRLQDPLAELVKIEPKSIGVGQYQHDVNQVNLSRVLDHVVEDCVNAVGVDINTASVPLLKSVSGLTQTLASNIVQYRNDNGAFNNRKTLKKVPRLGEKAFELAAGFLRINNAEHCLDGSAVHPEAYSLVDEIAEKTGKQIADLIGDKSTLSKLNANEFTSETFGLPTVQDIIAELEKPGRDPRQSFKTATFSEGIEKPSDLTEGMTLQGIVTNVTNFGAFVDIGVHQDGLVHISQLADHFVKDPNQIVQTGDIVKVTVLDVDLKRQRIALTMRSRQTAEKPSKPAQGEHEKKSTRRPKQQPARNNQQGTFGDALQEALNKTS